MDETTRQLIERALETLKDSHIQENKHRLGLLGSKNIDYAIQDLEDCLKKPNE